MADEMDELPVVLVLVACGIAPRRHPGETDAVPDDGEQLAIGEVLRASLAHVGRLWVQIAADLRLPAAVVGVTCGAVIGPMRASFRQSLVRERNRISALAHRCRYGEMSNR